MNTAIRPGILRALTTLAVVLALAAVVTTSDTPVHATNSGPDLVVGTPSMEFTNPYGGTNPFAGSQMTLSVTVTNSGDEASEATWLRGYRSTDSTITTSDTEEGGQTVSALAVAGTSSFDHGLTAPSEAGTYYYGVCVDSVTGESDTSNNCSSSVVITVLEPAPDLVVKEIDTSNNIVTGGSFRISVKVTNLGDAQSAATTLRWMQLADATETTTEIGTDDVRALTNPQANHESIRLTAPSTPGTYRYWACVDSVTDESDTTNNCSGRTTVTLTNNLATGAPTISGTAQVSQTLTASTSDISDADGLDNVSYGYQWLADDTEIDGATSSTYTVQSSDNGKVIKVRVTFTDDAGHEETLTSAATEVTAEDDSITQTDTVTATREGLPTEETEEETEQRLRVQYDANENGAIDGREVITAISDYLFDELITKDEVMAVINMYLFG